MRRLRAWLVRLTGLFTKRRRERELAEELESHLQMHIEDNLRAGMSPAEARRQALIKLGGLEQAKENYRDRRGLPMIETLIQDVRYGLRQLRRNPGFTAVAVLTLALGIGTNATIFTFVSALLLKPPSAIEKPSRLFAIWNQLPHGEPRYVQQNYPDYVYYREHNTVFAGLLAFSSDPQNVSWSTSGQSQLIEGQLVSGNFFSVLGVRPLLGRWFLPEEDQTSGRDPVVVLSHSFWQQRLGSDPAVVGKLLTLNGHGFRVVGVTPGNFKGIETILEPDLWAPIMMQHEIHPGDDLLSRRTSYWIYAVGRLKPGVASSQALAELNVLARQLAQAHPEGNKGWGAAVTPLTGVYDPDFRRFIGPLMMLLMTLVGLILLIACANAANLLLAQASNRSREMAIRAAIGASRGRLIRQVLTEAILLSFAAGCVGVLLANWTAPLLMNLKPPTLSFIAIEAPVDWRVLGFTFLVSLLTGVIFGLGPALRSSKVNVASRLRDESTTTAKSRLRNVLVVGEVALCMLLLIGAGLCLRSLQNAESIDPGFEISHRLAVSLDLRPLGYSESRGRSLYSQMLDRINTLPGVRSASLASYLPLGFTNLGVGIVIDGHEPRQGQPVPTAGLAAVGPRYFQTMGIPLLQGREFNSQDGETAPSVIVINQEMARRYWPGRNPIGQRISFAGGNNPSFEIVGVVKTGKYRGLREPAQPFMYRPLSQFYSTRATLVVQSAGDPKALLAPVQRAIHEIDSSVPVTDAETLEQYMSVPLFTAHLTGILLSALGLLALSLATAGLYAVVAYSVAQRTHEIGVRMALGAERREVMRLVVGQGFRLTLVGVGIGIVVALALTRFLSSILYGVKPTDPLTFAAVSLILTAAALAASYLPARRATKVDPMTALRCE